MVPSKPWRYEPTQNPEPWDFGLLALLVVLFVLVFLTGCTTTIKYVCPQLAPPPTKVVDALETTGRKDPSSAAWTVGLEKHYEKLDACKP